MGLAMANVASLLLTVGDPEEAEKAIAAKVTLEELHMMVEFDLDDGDQIITRAEYILLCAVRLGALNPDLIGKINERFKLLDTSGDGELSYDEILENPEAARNSIAQLHQEHNATKNAMHNKRASKVEEGRSAEKSNSTFEVDGRQNML